MGFPKGLIWNVDHAATVFRLCKMLLPICTQIFGVNAMELGSGPRLGMNPVGDAGNRDLFDRHSSPDVRPKTFAYNAMKRADPVGVATGAQRENRHAKSVSGIGHRLAETEKIVLRDFEFVRVRRQVTKNHFAWECVISCRYRRVRREDV